MKRKTIEKRRKKAEEQLKTKGMSKYEQKRQKRLENGKENDK